MSSLNFKLFKGCKGSIVDAIPIMIYVFVFAICTAFGYVIYQGLIDNGFFTLMNTMSNNATVDLQAEGETAYTALDYMGLFIFVGTTLAALMGALLIRAHPAFFFISIFVMILEIIISVPLANTWNAIITNSNFATAQTKFVIIGFIMNNFPVMILAALILLAVVMYAVNPFE